MALEGLGQWRRLRLPEMRKEASPGRLAAKGGPREVAWGRLCAETSSGLLYIALEVGSEAAGDKDDGEPPPCSVRASWR